MSEKPSYMPDPEIFNRFCYINDACEDSKDADGPMVDINVDPVFSLCLLIENLPTGCNDKTYRGNCETAPTSFRLPLRKILAAHITSPYGKLKEINIDDVHSLTDIESPHGSSIDYEKLIALLYEQVKARRDDILLVIDMPEFVLALTRAKSSFPSARIDHATKTITISRSEIDSFPNQSLNIVTSIRNIDRLDCGWTVVYTEDLDS